MLSSHTPVYDDLTLVEEYVAQYFHPSRLGINNAENAQYSDQKGTCDAAVSRRVVSVDILYSLRSNGESALESQRYFAIYIFLVRKLTEVWA